MAEKGLKSKGLGAVLYSFSQAQAQWEIQIGRTILQRRKKWLLLAVAPVLLGLLWSSEAGEPASIPASAATAATSQAATTPAASAAALPAALPLRGGKDAMLPAKANWSMFYGSIFVGLIAGLITGVIGAGGGYVLTPALMSFGVRGIMAVGTDQFHLFAKAIMGTTLHSKLGNVNVRLAVWFVVGSFVGVTLGGELNRAILFYSPAASDAFISLVYVIVLGSLAIYSIRDWVRRGRQGGGADGMTNFARWMQGVSLRPRVRFDAEMVPGGRSICIYPVILCGLLVGFVASIMGVGGGFLTFPIFVYGLGVSTFTTVGTDILQIIFTTAYSSIFQYAIYGFVFYTIAIGMLVGSLVGVQIGAMVTTVVKGAQIRAFFALTILAGFFNRLCALPRKLSDLGYIPLSKEGGTQIESVGVYLFFGTVGVFAAWILWEFFRHVAGMRRDRAGQAVAAGGPLIVDRGKFALGLFGLLVFAAVLTFALSMHVRNQSLLAHADNFFNQLAKQSANVTDKAKKQLQEDKVVNPPEEATALLAQQPVDLGLTPAGKVDVDKLHRVIEASGCRASRTADGRTRIRGSFGDLSRTAIADAELAFANRTQDLKAKYDMPADEAVYCWWIVFNGLTKRYTEEARVTEANFSKFMSSKVLEPAYNFHGIEAKDVRRNALPLAGLLAFCLVYTVWYGFSILLLMEGLGIRVAAGKDRKET